MTVDEFIGAIEQMRLELGWKEPTPETERLRTEAIARVDALIERGRAATDMPTIQRLQRELDGILPAYYRGLTALRAPR